MWTMFFALTVSYINSFLHRTGTQGTTGNPYILQMLRASRKCSALNRKELIAIR
jgi:hypothetical protein